MSDFDRQMVNCLNRFFKTKQIPGFAYKSKPQKNTPGRYADVVADSPDPAYNISIQCKSIIDRNLYLTQHFHAGKNTLHPLQAHSDFLLQTGRTGFLAVEFRQEPGKTHEAFLIPWVTVTEHFSRNKGLSLEDARNYPELIHVKDGYVLEHW